MNNTRRVTATLSMSFVATLSWGQIHVSPCGDDATGTGANWQSAYASIQKATSVASAGNKIWVARGTYQGTVVVPSGVTLIGGFKGTETALSQRIPHRYPTIIDGGNTTRCVDLVGGTLGQRTTLVDFIVQNGSGIPAGLRTLSSSVVEIRDCVFLNNTAQSPGASFIQAGGIGAQGGTDSRIIQNYFDTNVVVAKSGQSAVGGAISTQGGAHYIEGNVFYKNALTNTGTGVIGDGGAIRFGAGASPGIATVTANTFMFNSASVGGCISLPAQTVAAIDMDNNIYLQNSSGVYTPGNINSLTSIREVAWNTGIAFTGFTSNTPIVSDPFIVNANSGDFHLGRNTPLFGASNATYCQSNVDYDQDPRFVGFGWERGADEMPLTSLTGIKFIQGVVTIPGFTGSLRGYPVTVTNLSTSTVHNVNLDHRGNFLVYDFGGPVTFNISIKGYNTLSHVITNLTIPTNGATQVTASLCSGDIDGDDTVSIFDYAELSTSFGKLVCDPTCNDAADLDGDGEVTIFDYLILSTNFDMQGPC
ncbi:MAG: hypothetical protein JST40_13600 [Armatimonadetes bacterium]|nr:hypothetical protein [Armatimonadota bacterium]